MQIRRYRVWLLVLVHALVVGACSPTVPSPPPRPSPPSSVTHRPAVVPRDRDLRAVLSALRGLDPCALVDPARAGVPGYPATITPVPHGPHRCTVSRADDDDRVDVVLGASFNAARRMGAAIVTIGGVKAYRIAYPDSCMLAVPVSFTLTIQVSARTGLRSTSGDLCVSAAGFAAFAVAALADPAAAASVLPMADRDACQVLTAALAANPEGYRVTFDEELDGIDSCRGDNDPDKSDSVVDAHLEYGPALPTHDIRTIGGQPVVVYAQFKWCHLYWSVGKVHTSERGRTDQQVALNAPDCDIGEAMVLAAMTYLRQPPPAASAPQRPLTYRPDEPDVPVPGACALYITFDDPHQCQPAIDVRVPSGGAAILRGVAADPHVLCALSRAAVTRHFGSQFVPIVTGRACTFVEPTGAVQVRVSTDADDRPHVQPGGRSASISGHTAALHDNNSDPASNRDPAGIRFDAAVAASSDTALPGTVLFTAEFHHARGTPADTSTPPDTTLASDLVPAATDVISTHFATR